MQKIIKLVVFLAIVSGLSGLCLSVVNGMTAPIIEEAKLAAVKENLQVLYSSGDFKEETLTADSKLIQNVYSVTQGGSVTGYVYKVGVNGYGGEVSYLVGINKDGSYQGFICLDCSTETSGFGSRVGTDEFSSKFNGKKAGDGIDTLSGATITSTAVVNGIGDVVDHFNANYK